MFEVKNHLCFSPLMLSWRAIRLLFVGTILIANQRFAVAAEQEWWFDVEIILFKHDSKFSELSEKFVSQEINTEGSKALDLLTPYLRPDLSYLRANLPFCRASNRAKKQQQFEQDFAFPAPPKEPELDNNDIVNELDDTNTITNLDESNSTTRLNHATAGLLTDKTTSVDEYTKTKFQTELSGSVGLSDEPIGETEVAYVPQDTSVEWLEWQIPKQLPCVYSEQLALLSDPFAESQDDELSLQDITKVPVKINGINWQQKGQAFLLPQSELNLRSLFTSINRQRDLQSMLYLGWRQEVKFGQEKAQSIRLFAGQNYASTFLPNGHLKPVLADNSTEELTPYLPIGEELVLSSQEQINNQNDAAQLDNSALFADIYQSFAQKDQILDLDVFFTRAKTQDTNPNKLSPLHKSESEIWQLDGELKVYLQNVGRTPYLHIDSSFDYRQPVFDPSLQITSSATQEAVVVGAHNMQANRLESVNVKHFKRVISKQLHYFDHPLFGMVVYITRYQWPDEVKQPDDNNDLN
jgi:hypothetical protein